MTRYAPLVLACIDRMPSAPASLTREQLELVGGQALYESIVTYSNQGTFAQYATAQIRSALASALAASSVVKDTEYAPSHFYGAND